MSFFCCCCCLQEVETEQYYNFFLPELKEQGYDGFFSPKSRARTMSESDRKHVDGCAIFYKTEKYVPPNYVFIVLWALSLVDQDLSELIICLIFIKVKHTFEDFFFCINARISALQL